MDNDLERACHVERYSCARGHIANAVRSSTPPIHADDDRPLDWSFQSPEDLDKDCEVADEKGFRRNASSTTESPHSFSGMSHPPPGMGVLAATFFAEYETRSNRTLVSKPYPTVQTGIDNAKDPIRALLSRVFPCRPVHIVGAAGANITHANQQPPDKPSGTVDVLARLIVSILCMALLLVPMMVMITDPSKTKGLAVVSVAVGLFSLTMSLVFQASSPETMVATATYAAVLVVFLGLNGAGGSI